MSKSSRLLPLLNMKSMVEGNSPKINNKRGNGKSGQYFLEGESGIFGFPLIKLQRSATSLFGKLFCLRRYRLGVLKKYLKAKMLHLL